MDTCRFIRFIIGFNITYAVSDYLYDVLPLMRDFKIDLFHATAQMFPISLSISYYQTNDRFIDISFATIFVMFMYKLYAESRKMAYDSDNNTKILKIISLCIMLDYLQVIILMLSKLHCSNSFYVLQIILTIFH